MSEPAHHHGDEVEEAVCASSAPLADSDCAFIGPASFDAARAVLHRCVDLGLSFKCRESVVQLLPFADMLSLVVESLPEHGVPLDRVLDEVVEKVLPHSTNYASPYAMAFPDCGSSVAAVSGGILGLLVNQNLINWVPCAPMATVVEMLLLNWFRSLVGFPFTPHASLTSPAEVAGVVTSGGVASNTLALLLARERAAPNTMMTGVTQQRQRHNYRYAVIVPGGVEHYSARVSLGWLGLGEDSVVKVRTRHFRYDMSALASSVEQLRADGRQLLMVVAYAGDSRSLTCDDFVSLRALCDGWGAWLHIDGCHGTQLLFSDADTLRAELRGVDMADSISFDPHKVLATPYTVRILLVRDPRDMAAVRRPEDIITGEAHSFGQLTPFYGSRAFDSLKLYLLIKHLGRAGIGRMVDWRCAMARTPSRHDRADAGLRAAQPSCKDELGRVHVPSRSARVHVARRARPGAQYTQHTHTGATAE